MILLVAVMLTDPIQAGAPIGAQIRVPSAAPAPQHRGDVTIPRLIFLPNISAHYPVESLARGDQGTTRLRCTLRITGELSGCALARSSGFPELDAAAFRVAEQARYQPMLVDGKAVDAPVILPVRWQVAE